MRPQIVFLDVGGVILELDTARALEPLGITDKNVQAEIWKKVSEMPNHHRFERGEICEEDFFKFVANEFKTNLTFEELKGAWNRLVVREFPDANQIFDTFSGKVPLVALSNTNVCHYRHIMKEFPVLKRFDRFLSSFEIGHRKPEEECFLAAATEMNVRPESCVLIDDNEDNIFAAKRVGFRAFKSVNSVPTTLDILSKLI